RLRTEPVQIEISPGDREGWSVVTLTASPEWPSNRVDELLPWNVVLTNK
ncbi:TPA: hypothetical protein ACUAG4_005215, partial [Escherichia coli]